MSIPPKNYPENPGVDIFVNYCNPGTPEGDYHYHTEHYELCFVLSGDYDYYFDFREYHLTSQEVLFLAPGKAHLSMTDCPENARRVIINFNDRFLNQIRLNPPLLKEIFTKPILLCPEKDTKEFHHLLTKLVAESDYPSIFSTDLAEHYMYELLVRLYRIAKEIPNRNPLQANTIIEMVTKYICEHYPEELTLDLLADYCHVSKFYLSKLFKFQMGMNLFTYINSIRIHEATKLLTETDKSILEISQEVGYNSLKRFCEVFKQEKGISANQYRRLL